MPNTYRFLAELDVDRKKLIKLLGGQFIRYKLYRDGVTHAVSEVVVHDLSLEEIRELCRRVPDGHYMVQTIQPKELFTGVRDFSVS